MTKGTQKSSPKGRASPRRRLDQAREEMITKYLPFVRFVAEKIHRRLPPGVDFEIYARYRVQGEVMQCLRSLDWVSRSVRSWGRKIEAARAKFAGRFIREPSAEEMSKELEIPLETYYRLDQRVNDATLLSLEDLSVASEVDREGAHQNLTQDVFLEPLSFVENRDLVDKLAEAVERLRVALGVTVKAKDGSPSKRAADARKPQSAIKPSLIVGSH